MPPYRFLEDAPTADVGFVATGATLDACFQAAADATLAVMLANPESLQPRLRRALHVEADSVDLALLRFIEEFVYAKDADRHTFARRRGFLSAAGQSLAG